MEAVEERPLAAYGDLLTTEELAEVLSVSTRTVYRLVDDGEIPCCKVGHRLYFSRDKICSLLHLGE